MLSILSLVLATPFAVEAQVLARLMNWQPDLPRPSSEWRPGLVGSAGEARSLAGTARKGSVLLSIPVRHAATGVITDNPRMSRNIAKRTSKHVGQPVYAIALAGMREPVWCRWEAKPRKPFLAWSGVDPVPTAECYPVVNEIASPVDVFGPQGLFVTSLRFNPSMTAHHPGLRIELKPQEIGPPMRLEFAVERITAKSVRVIPAVRWAGGEAPLPPIEVEFGADGSARVPILDGEFTLSRSAADPAAVEARISKAVKGSYEGVHLL